MTYDVVPGPSSSSHGEKNQERSVEAEVSGPVMNMEEVEENERQSKKQRLHSPPVESKRRERSSE